MRLFAHRRIWLGCGLLVALVGLLFVFPYLAEPRYQGKRLSSWLRQYLHGNARAQAEAKEAVLAIGPEGVATLMRLLIPPRESSLKQLLEKKLNVEFIRDEADESAQRQMGAMGFHILGERAAPAIPHLVPLLHETDSGRARLAREALTSIGAPALPALQMLLASTNPEVKRSAVRPLVAVLKTNEFAWHSLLTNTDPEIRGEAYLVLSIHARHPGSKVYELILAGLNDPHELAASRAALAFRVMGDVGTNALPRLSEFEKTTNALLATEVAWTIKSLQKKMRLQQSRQTKSAAPD